MKGRVYILFLFLLAGKIALAQTFFPLADTNFVQFLRVNIPATITNGNKLVIAEAAKVRGDLTISNKRLYDVNGLQFFISLQSIDLSRNDLTSLPDISGITNLDYLNISSNRIAQIPDLKKLTKLTYLDFYDNKVTSILDLSSQGQLKTLVCNENLLTSLPPLDSLKNLTSLDASYNMLTEFPKLPVKNKILVIHLNNNQIKTLPDSFNFPNLNNLFLWYNKLTFTELKKIATYTGSTIKIYFSPQQTFEIGTTINAKEKGSINLSTHIDEQLPNIEYVWSKNGVPFKTITSDSLELKNLSFQDSGKYTCRINNLLYPGTYLSTDTFYVKVIPCFDPQKLSTTITGISCRKEGSLIVQNPTGESVSYSLNSTASSSIIKGNGNFFGLTEPSYTLKVITKNGCEKTYPYEILIPKEDCKQVLLTPNGDGENEEFFFTQKGKVIIYDKRGEQVKTLQIPAEWDGSAKEGKVAPGYYTADINNGESFVNISVIY